MKLLTYFLPLLLFTAAAIAIYPCFRYRIVSDDISYLAITQRYLNGDLAHAVNGYWSPLNPWLLAMLVKFTGWGLLPAAYVLNSLSFAGVLLLSIRLTDKMVAGRFEVWGIGFCAALFWAANLPLTRFADALNCFLLLTCLLLLLREDFTRRPLLWVVYGLLSAIAYFSKAYSFYIIPLSTALLLWRILWQQERFTIRRWSGILLVTTGTMLLFALPWLWILHEKYGTWMISSAGPINTSWAIAGTIYFSREYPVLVPPAYPGGLSCWEDPWMHRGPMITAFDSATLLGKQLFRISMNILQWFRVINEYSPFYFPVWIASIFYLLRRKGTTYQSVFPLVIISFLVFPAGYLLLFVGTRYLWYTVPLVMAGGLLLVRTHLKPILRGKLYHLLIVTYCASWLPGSLSVLKESFREGAGDYAIAEQLKGLSVKGSFITNHYPQYQNHFRISWFTGNPYYMYFGDRYSTEELLEEAKRLQVDYYYYFYDGSSNDYKLLHPDGTPYPEMTGGRIEGLKVFRLKEE